MGGKKVTQLDDNFLAHVGLDGLHEEDKKTFLAHVYDELKLRIGDSIAKDLNEEKMAEFEQLPDDIEADDARRWFEENYPAYKTVVTAELENIKREIMASKDQILGVS